MKLKLIPLLIALTMTTACSGRNGGGVDTNNNTEVTTENQASEGENTGEETTLTDTHITDSDVNTESDSMVGQDGHDDSEGSNIGNAADDVGNAAEDIGQGAGDAAADIGKGAGDAAGSIANGIGDLFGGNGTDGTKSR